MAEGFRVCVFGAGAIGGHLAGRLAEGGATVSVVARGAQLAALQRDGLRVEAPDRTMHAKVAATDDPTELGPQDCVIVTVKAPALPSVASGIGPLLGPDTPVAFAMNGIPWWYFHKDGGPYEGRRLRRVDPDDALWNAVGPERAIGCVVFSACTVVAPGVVHVEGSSRLVLGEPDGSPSARVAALAAPMQAGGLKIETTAAIRDAIWSKLLLNLCSGPICTLAQSAQKAVFAEPACRESARRAIEEGVAIAHAIGRNPAHDVDRILAAIGGREHKPSIVQDLELGRPMEVDALFTVPLEFARLAGVSTPTLDLLISLLKLRAEAAGLYTP